MEVGNTKPEETPYKMPFFKELGKMSAAGLMAYTIHYGTTKFYNGLCIPDGVYGFIQGMVTTGSPWCELAMKVSSHSSTLYVNFVLIGMSRMLIELIPTG
jgi:hypothetical protein